MVGNAPGDEDKRDTECRKDAGTCIDLQVIVDKTLPLQVPGEEEDTKRIGEDDKVDERCDNRELDVGLDRVGVLDHPEDTPEDHVGMVASTNRPSILKSELLNQR